MLKIFQSEKVFSSFVRLFFKKKFQTYGIDKVQGDLALHQVETEVVQQHTTT